MTAKELAALLNGREYGKEITKEEEAGAKGAGLVAVFAYSDDNAELRGAINDEVGCWNGGKIRLTPTGLFKAECDDERCPYVAKARARCRTIEALWCAPDSPAWTYKTDIPHETFEIMEDGEVYCRGIVFALADVSPAA